MRFGYLATVAVLAAALYLTAPPALGEGAGAGAGSGEPAGTYPTDTGHSKRSSTHVKKKRSPHRSRSVRHRKRRSHGTEHGTKSHAKPTRSQPHS